MTDVGRVQSGDPNAALIAVPIASDERQELPSLKIRTNVKERNMTRTVTALYDSRNEAELACDRLKSTFETCSTNIIENSDTTAGSGAEASDSSLTNLYVSDEDRDAYGEGVRRGGFMLCAEVSSDEDADSIIEVLEQTTPVDMDQRQQDWRNEGWQPGSASSQTDSGNIGGASGNFDSQSGTRKVGTRDTERGGSSVRSYARDTSAESDSFSGSDSSGTDDFNRR